MSDWYEVLMIYDVDEEQSQSLANEVRDLLITEQFIHPIPNEDCVLGGTGHPPGPRVKQAYRDWSDPYENNFRCKTNGVEFCVTRYINFYGMSESTPSSCPRCDQQYAGNENVIEAFVSVAENFLENGTFSTICCPNCKESVAANEWNVSDLGLCFLAIRFWNWPPFDKPKGAIQMMIEAKFGCKVVNSYGRI